MFFVPLLNFETMPRCSAGVPVAYGCRQWYCGSSWRTGAARRVSIFPRIRWSVGDVGRTCCFLGGEELVGSLEEKAMIHLNLIHDIESLKIRLVWSESTKKLRLSFSLQYAWKSPSPPPPPKKKSTSNGIKLVWSPNQYSARLYSGLIS